jgi:acyl-CoA synthetase (AMP-forming)/AMP-acid ligase II
VSTGVVDAALIGEPDEKWGEVGLMIVLLAQGQRDGAELKAFCKDRLARYKIPKRVIFTDALPTRPMAKS